MAIDIDKAMPLLADKVKDLQVPIVDLLQAQTGEPWKVLVATILSARTNDMTTAAAVTKLFKKVATLEQLADLSLKAIEKLIYPVGFYRNKAKYLQQLPGALQEQFDGIIPQDVESLTQLPGVGRKTANLVVAVAFNKPAICVDTHVHRMMNIWQYVETKTPLETEMALRDKLPQKYWIEINSILVAYGQSICRPVSPRCDACVIGSLCPKHGVTPRKVKKKKSKSSLLLMSWNVNGIRAVQKKGFVDILQEEAPDILGIQETKAQPDQLDDALKNIPGYDSYWFSAERKGYSSVAVYSRIKPLKVINGIGVDQFDVEGRVITLEFETFFFVNGYYPNAQDKLARIDYKVAFNDAIRKYCNTLKKTKTVVLCGDFNVAHKAIDLKNPKQNENNAGYSQPERDGMDRFIKAGYVDTFRLFNQEPGHYTWWTYRFQARAKDIGWRIDYFCVDKESKHRVLDAGIRKEVMGSDHCPVTIILGPA
ncbi:exodeoxyribonuclease III [Planctomycetota bacterium]